MKFLSNLKVRHKLLGILGTVIAGFLLVALAYKIERDIETRARNLEQQANQINTLLYQIQIDVLQARHHEKDFFAASAEPIVRRAPPDHSRAPDESSTVAVAVRK